MSVASQYTKDGSKNFYFKVWCYPKSEGLNAHEQYRLKVNATYSLQHTTIIKQATTRLPTNPKSMAAYSASLRGFEFVPKCKDNFTQIFGYNHCWRCQTMDDGKIVNLGNETKCNKDLILSTFQDKFKRGVKPKVQSSAYTFHDHFRILLT